MTPTKPTTVTEVTEADRALCRRLRDQKDATPKSPRFEMGYEQAIVEIAAHRAAAVEAACKPLLDALEKIARETYSMIDAGAIAEKALRQHAQPPAQQEATEGKKL